MLITDHYSDDLNENADNHANSRFVLESDPKDETPIVVKP